jgi:hypothetical protein
MMMHEEVLRMAVVALVSIAIVVFLGATAWAALREARTDDEVSPAKNSAQAREATRPQTLEGVLVRQLMEHEIAGPQYRRAMRRLAERDADRHPLTVPREN